MVTQLTVTQFYFLSKNYFNIIFYLNHQKITAPWSINTTIKKYNIIIIIIIIIMWEGNVIIFK